MSWSCSVRSSRRNCRRDLLREGPQEGMAGCHRILGLRRLKLKINKMVTLATPSCQYGLRRSESRRGGYARSCRGGRCWSFSPRFRRAPSLCRGLSGGALLGAGVGTVWASSQAHAGPVCEGLYQGQQACPERSRREWTAMTPPSFNPRLPRRYWQSPRGHRAGVR